MSVRLNVVLSDDLNAALESVADESTTTKSEVFRKALQLYLAARDGTKRGMKLGLASDRAKLDTEIIGL
jgi:predicted transcriptional regulator